MWFDKDVRYISVSTAGTCLGTAEIAHIIYVMHMFNHVRIDLTATCVLCYCVGEVQNLHTLIINTI